MRILIPDLMPGTNYAIQVRTVRNGDVSEWSPRFELLTDQNLTAPRTPTAVTWEVSGDSFIGSWDSVTTDISGEAAIVTGYEVELVADGITKLVTVGQNTGSRVTYTLPLSDNKALFSGIARPQITMRVRAVNNKDIKSLWSSANIAINPAPEAPVSATTNSGIDGFTVEWEASVSDDVVKYHVYSSGAGANFTPTLANRIGTVSAPSTSFSYTTATYAVHYLRVYSVDAFGQESTEFAAAQATPQSPFIRDITPPDAPTGVSVSSGYDHSKHSPYLDVSWSANTEDDLAEYTVRYGASANGPWETMRLDKDATSTRIFVAPGTYHVGLNARDWDANASEYTSATGSPITTAADTLAPKAPIGLSAVVQGSSFIATWTPVTQNTDNSPINDLKHYEVGVKNGSTEVFYTLTDNQFTFGLDQNRMAFTTPRSSVIFRVRAVDQSGNTSAWSTNVTATNAGPANVTAASAVGGANVITVTWEGSNEDDIAGYNVYQGNASNPTTKVGFFTGNIYVATVSHTNTQHFGIRAVDVFGQESAASALASAAATDPFAVDTTPPAAPGSLAATVTNNSNGIGAKASVTWTNGSESDLAGTEISYKLSTDTTWSSLMFGRDTASAIIDLPRAHATYNFRARSFDRNANYSAPAATVTAAAPANVAPAQVTGLSVTNSLNSFVANWDAVTTNSDSSSIEDFSHYEVEATAGATSTTFTSAENRFVLDAESNRIAFGTASTTVSFRVRAVDRLGLAGAWSTTQAASAGTVTPPTALTGKGGANAITITWTESTYGDVVGYNIYQGTTANPTTKAGFVRASIFSTTITTTAGQFFSVRAVDSFGRESASLSGGPWSATNPFLVDTTAPAVPGSLAATVTNNSNGIGARASLTWTNGSETDRAGIEVSYKRSTDSVWSSTIFGKDATSGVIELPAAYAAYNFRIRAYDRSANYSAWSSTVSASAPANVAPDNVTGLAGTSTANSITYRWDALADEDIKGYEITFSTSSTFASGNTTYMAGNTNTLTVSGLNSNTNYYARIRAVDTAGLTSASWSSTNTTKTKTYNSALTDGVAPASSPTPVLTSRIGSIYANWPAASNADPVTYEVHLSTTSGFTPSAGTMVTETPGTFAPIETTPNGTPLSHGVTYYVRLVAKDADGKAPVGAQASGTIRKVTGDDTDLNPEDVGAPSTDEFDDLAGKVDTSVKSYVIEYALNSSETAPPTSGWSTATPVRAPGAFIWTRTVITYQDNSTTTSNPALLTGNTGAQGDPGQNATERYTWVRYADTPTTGMSATPTGKTYMGIAYNKTSATPSSNYSDYQWSLIKGADGSDGKGISNTEVRYAKSAIGDTAPASGWVSSVPSTNPGEFLWTRTVTTYTDSSTSTAYSVAAHGATGPTGSAGRGISETEVRYQKHNNGTTAPTGTWSTSIPATSPGEYLWTRTVTTFTSGTPATVTSYSVARHGETGQQGVPGPPGEDGQPTYTWIKYAPNGSPTSAQMSDDPAGMTHIGIAHNKNTQVESTTPSDYTWALIQGPQGPAGQDGADAPVITLTATAQALVSPPGGGATTPATSTITGTALNTTIPNNTTGWQYSVNGGTFSGTVPEGVSRSGNIVTITGATMTARTIAVKAAGGGTSDTITIAKVSDGAKGDTGATGAPGSDGRGITTTTIDYAKSSSGTSVPTTGWSTTIPSTSAGQYLWTRTTTNYTSGDPDYAYSVARHGATGAAGRGISSTDIAYAKSTNGTTAPTSGWGTSIPATTTGEFLWTRTITNYTSGSPASDTAYSVSAHGAPGAPGADAYTVLLTNEAMVFPGTVSAAIAGEETTNVIAYKGSTQVSVTVGTITGQVTGLTTSVTSNNTTSPVIQVNVTTALTAQTGTLNVPITVDGKTFTKRISWSVSRKGDTGAQGPKGDDAPVVTVTSTSQALISPATGGATTPATAVVTGSAQNTTITTVEFSVNGSSTWSDSNPTGVTGSGATRTITGANLASSTRTVAVRMKDANGVSDTITIAKVSDGAKGDTGSTGAPGSDGVGVSGTTVTYQVSSNATTPPTGTWHSTVQSTNPGQYLWTRTVTTYTDGSSNIANPAYSVAKHGSTGATGAAGRSLTGTTVTYGVSSSGTTQPSSWSETIPSTSPGQFLWTKTTTTYSSAPTSVDSFSVAKHGETGAAGQDAYTVLMTNEAMVFAGSTSAALAGSETTSIIAYKGTTQQSATVGTITGQVTGLTTSVTNNGTNAPVITVSVTTALTTQTGVLTVPITVDGKVFNKTISWSVSRKGATGSTGGTGPQGVSVTAITPYYARVAASASAPTQPTTQATPPSPWTSVEPGYLFDTKMYRTDRISYSNSTYSWTTVVESSAYQAAVTAIDTADGKNKIIFSTSAASGTNYKAGDIWYRKSGSDIIGVWEFTTSWQSRTLRDEVLKSLSVGKLASGSIDTAAITLASSGKIESQNYDSASSGFRLTSSGIEIKGAPLSISNVSGLQDTIDLTYSRKGKVWTQDTAPVPTAIYEWTGTPHNSPSIKKIDGIEVARNHARNPSVESNIEWRSNHAAQYPASYSNEVYRSGGRSLSQKWVTPGLGLFSLYNVGGFPINVSEFTSSTISHSIWIFSTVPGWARLGVSFRDAQTESYSTTQGNNVELRVGQWTLVSQTINIPEGVDLFRSVLTGQAYEAVGDGVYAWADDYMLVDGLELPEYFDGDTAEFANDLWIDTANGNKPHRWVNNSWQPAQDEDIKNSMRASTHMVVNQPAYGSGGAFASSPNWGNIIEVDSPVHLGYATMYADASGTAVISLRRDNALDANEVETKTVNLTSGANRIMLDMLLTPGRWWLGVPSATVSLWRNTSGVSWPYETGTFRIIGRRAAGESGIQTDNFYYFFYDLEVAGQGVTGAPSSLAYPGKTTIDGAVIETGTVSADVISANSTFTQNLNVNSTFTLGSASTPGIIKSWNYNQASKTGFSLSSSGLEIWQGKVNAAALEAGTTITSNLGVTGLLTIGTGGAIESQNYSAASSGFRLTSTGIQIKGAPLTISNVSGLQADLNAKETPSGAQAKADAAALKASITASANNNAKTFHNPLTWGLSINNGPGTIVIDTPITFTARMCEINIRGFNYVQSNNIIDLSVGFYAYNTSSFYAQTSVQNRSTDTQLGAVRLAVREATGTVAILIDTNRAGWFYPKITVTEATIGHTNPPDAWLDGWSGALKTDLSEYVNIVTPARQDFTENHSVTTGWRTTGTTTIDGGKITADSVTALQLAARSVTANHMVIKGENMLADPTFEVGSPHWAGGGARLAGAGRTGAAWSFTNNSTQQVIYNMPYDAYEVQEGEHYYLSAYIRNNGAPIPVGGFSMGVRVTRTDGGQNWPVVSNTEVIPAGVWTKVSGITTAMPAGAKSMSFYIASQSGLSSGTLLVDQVHMSRAATGELIVDGSIKANHVDANVFTGKTFYVGSGGTVQSATFNASSGFQLSSTGLTIRGNSVIDAGAIRAGNLGGPAGTNSVINVTSGTSLIMNGGYIKSNTNDGTTLATAEASGAGFFLNADGLFIGGTSRIKASALISDTLTSTTIKLGSGGVIESDGYTGSGSGFRLTANGLDIPNGSINIAKVNITNGSISGDAITSISGDKITTGSIKSTNYHATNKTGWIINTDGSAEFANLNVWGDTTVGSGTANYIRSAGGSTTEGWYLRGDGALFAKNADITGKITATSGSIAGTSITSTALTLGASSVIQTSTSGTAGVKINTANGIRVFNGSTTPVFQVTATGNTTIGGTTTVSGDTTLNGTLTLAGTMTTSGNIVFSGSGSVSGGGWSLSATGLSIPNGGIKASHIEVTKGLADSLINTTTIDGGKITTGSIKSSNYNSTNKTGWIINTNGAAEFANLNVWGDTTVGSGTANYIRSAGGSTTEGWYLRGDGKLFAQDVDIRGKITATSGTIGGTTITSTTLTGGIIQTSSSNLGIKLDNTNGIRGFNTSGAVVFHVAANGNTEIGGTTTLKGTTILNDTLTLGGTMTTSGSIVFSGSGKITAGSWQISSSGISIPNGAIEVAKINLTDNSIPGNAITSIDGGRIQTGVIQSSQTETVNGVARKKWSIDLDGIAQFAGMNIYGNVVVGDGPEDQDTVIQSSNYMAGESGWILRGDGTGALLNLDAGSISANVLTSGSLTDSITIANSGTILARNEDSGARVGISGTEGFFVDGPDSEGNPSYVHFPLDGAPNIISGNLDANVLTVTDATIKDKSVVDVGASLILNNTPNLPPPPAVQARYPSLTMAGSEGNIDVGSNFTYYSGHFYRIIRLNVVTARLIQYDPNTGAQKTYVDFVLNFPNVKGIKSLIVYSYTTSGTTVTGFDIKLLALQTDSQGLGVVRVLRASSSWTSVVMELNTPTDLWVASALFEATAIIGDGTSGFVVASAWKGTPGSRSLQLSRRTDAGTLVSGSSITTNLSFDADPKINSVLHTNGDFGSIRYVLDVADHSNIYVINSTGTVQTNENFPKPPINSFGTGWDSVNNKFYSYSIDNVTGGGKAARIYRYTGPTWTTQSSRWAVAYSRGTSSNHTPLSQIAYINMPKRAALHVTFDMAGMDQVRVWVGRGAGVVPASQMYHQGTFTGTGSAAQINTVTFSGQTAAANKPPDFPPDPGSIAVIKSTATDTDSGSTQDSIRIQSDGSARIRNLTAHNLSVTGAISNGLLPVRMASGVVNITVGASTTTVYANVSFPAGRFTSTPTVIAQQMAGNANFYMGGGNAMTKDGFTANASKTGTSGQTVIPIHWVAIQWD